MTEEQETKLRKYFGVNDQFNILKELFDEIMSTPKVEPVPTEVPAKKKRGVHKRSICKKTGWFKEGETCECEG